MTDFLSKFEPKTMPKQKPPRLDLRNRKRKDIAHSQPKIALPKKPKLASALRFASFGGSEIDREYREYAQKINFDKIPDEIILEFEAKDWVFTQSTAIASVNIVSDNDWQITTNSMKYINDNHNAWTTDTLRRTYKTLIGAMNLKDHIDISQGGLCYGMIIGAVPRRINVGDNEYVLYIDTLIATNRHIDKDWARAIERGQIRYMSVGYSTDFVMCSKCGHIYCGDGYGICPCNAYELGMIYYDTQGRKSKVAQMCLDLPNDDARGVFNELSYLSVNPAFSGATQSHLITPPKDSKISIKVSGITLARPAYLALKDYIKAKRIIPQG